MAKVWYVKCKPFVPDERGEDNEKLQIFQGNCLENRVFGIGWRSLELESFINNEKMPFDYDLAESLRRTNRSGKFTIAQKRMGMIKVGDGILTKLLGCYYFGIVEEPVYILKDDRDLTKSEEKRLTWCSTIKDKWLKIGKFEDLPNSVRGCIHSKNLQGTVSELSVFSSCSLMRKFGIKLTKEKLDSENFYLALDDSDFEDLICQYMSEENKEYVFLPSSCKKNTPGIEYIMYNPNTNEKIACQVKVAAEIDIKTYLNRTVYGEFKRVYLCSGIGKYKGSEFVDSDSICIVPNNTLFSLLKSNRYFRDILDEYFEILE